MIELDKQDTKISKTTVNEDLYKLLKSRANNDGLPIMSKTMFLSTTEKYGKEIFRSTLAEYITREKPPYPFKQFEEEEVVRIFRRLERAKFTDYIHSYQGSRRKV